VAENPSLAALARDARCYDAVLWWTHHVPEERKPSPGQ